MKNIYLVDIEYIPTRYSSQWKNWIPQDIRAAGLNCVVVDGPENKKYETTPGGFFNFFETNQYKMVQGQKLANLFMDKKVKDNDIFLFTDGWHPAVISLRQMINLSGIKAQIFGMFHAGSYDLADILGQTCRQNFLNIELGYLECLDKAFFATDFSRKLMLNNMETFDTNKRKLLNKMYVTGFPYKFDHLYETEKENIILFPHRISPEKHIELFRTKSKVNNDYKCLEELLPEYKFVVTLEETKNKKEFHDLLAKAKFSAVFSDQETWGISVFESLASGCIPIVPNKLSYVEMYTDDIKYDPYDSELFFEDKFNWPLKVATKIKEFEKKSDSTKQKIIIKNLNNVKENFCTLDNIVTHLKG